MSPNIFLRRNYKHASLTVQPYNFFQRDGFRSLQSASPSTSPNAAPVTSSWTRSVVLVGTLYSSHLPVTEVRFDVHCTFEGASILKLPHVIRICFQLSPSTLIQSRSSVHATTRACTVWKTESTSFLPTSSKSRPSSALTSSSCRHPGEDHSTQTLMCLTYRP